MPNELSDIATRLNVLEQEQTKTPEVIRLNIQEKVWFKEKVKLVDDSSSTQTDWADSGCARYLPSDAKEAIVFAIIDDTTDGSGRTYLEGRGAGVIKPLAAIYEPTAPDFSSGCAETFMPLSGGRFDYRLVLGSGASGAGIGIYLVGYTR